MRLPVVTAGIRRNGGVMSSTSRDGIEPQRVKCELSLTGSRTGRCGPSWARFNCPEFKEGQCIEYGEGCDDCLSKCRDQFTSAGGWSVRSEWGRQCNEV